MMPTGRMQTLARRKFILNLRLYEYYKSYTKNVYTGQHINIMQHNNKTAKSEHTEINSTKFPN